MAEEPCGMPEGHTGKHIRAAALKGKRERDALARKAMIAERQGWIDAYKVSKGCTDCGYNANPKAIDFDHLLPDLKTANVSALVRFASWEDVLTEIDKCVLRCANCHRVKTHSIG